MCHYFSVLSFTSSRRKSLALIAVLGCLVPAYGQKKPQPPAKRPVGEAPGSAGSAAVSFDTTQLQQGIAAQSAAVRTGDPAAIVAASRRLNAEIYVLLAQFRLSQGKLQEASAMYEQSLQWEPSTGRRLEFAAALLRRGRYLAAIAQADIVLASDPESVAAWSTRGSALRASGQYGEAVIAFGKASRHTSDSGVLYALGASYLGLHRQADAEEIFHRLLSATGESPVWQVAVGDAYRDAGATDEAVRYLQHAIARDPRVPHGEFFLGLTYLQSHQWGPNADSYEHFRRAVALAPREYLPNFYLGAMESTEGSDLVASDRHLRAAAAADPGEPEVWLYLGTNALRERRSGEARAALRKAIDLTGSDESRNNYQVRRAYFALGRLLITEGNRVEGEALLAKYRAAQQAAVAESGRAMGHPEGVGTDGEGMAAPAMASLAANDAHVAGAVGAGSESAADASAATAQSAAVQQAAEARLRALLANTLNDQGTAEARQHDYANALIDFQQAERWAPEDPLTLRNLGTAAFRVEDHKEAVRALSRFTQLQGIAAQPVDPHVHLLLGMSQFALGEFREAADSFKAAGPAALQDQTVAYSYAFALARGGRAQEANQVADTLLSEPLNADLLPLVCHVYIDTENYEGSQVCYRKALQAQPGLALAHYEIGESLIHLDRPAEAIPELRKELESDSHNPNVNTALAFALLQTSDKQGARKILEATAAEHPEHAQAQYELGKLLIDSGEMEQGVAHLERSEAANPDQDYVHFQLGNAYRKLGRQADAEREYRMYRQIKDQNRNTRAVPH